MVEWRSVWFTRWKISFCSEDLKLDRMRTIEMICVGKNFNFWNLILKKKVLDSMYAS